MVSTGLARGALRAPRLAGVYRLPRITPHDFAVMDDTSGNQVSELLVVGANERGLVKTMARAAEPGEELFRNNVS